MTPPALAMLRAQTVMQLRCFLRLPAASVTSLALPVMLYGFFALPHADDPAPGGDGVTIGALMLASLGAYAVANIMMFNFGVQLATERAQKVDLLMRATPLPAWVNLAARALTALLFGVLVLVVLMAFTAITGGVRLPPGTWVSLAVRLLLGALPFIALGFALGYGLGPSVAPAAANLIFITIAFPSGMLVPLSQLPAPVQRIAVVLPTYHSAQLGFGALGIADESTAAAAGALAAWTAVLTVAALVAYRREAARKFA